MSNETSKNDTGVLPSAAPQTTINQAPSVESRREVLPNNPLGVELAREAGRYRRRDQKHFGRIMDRMG